MNKTLKIASYIFSVLFSVFIIYFAIRNSNIDDSWHLIEKANYWFLVPVLFSSLLGNIIRASRWKLLLHGYPVGVFNLFLALMSAYCVNYGIPRLGEFTRCWSVQRREKIPLAEVAGTVVIERVVDVLCLFMIVLFTVFFQYEKFQTVFDRYLAIPFQRFESSIFNHPLLIGSLIVFLLAGCAFIYFMGRKVISKLGHKLTKTYDSFVDGLKSIIKMPQKGLFFFYTFLIWVGYFGTSYFVFQGVEGGELLPISAGIAVLAFGSIARTIPLSAGSAGLYHAVVVLTLSMFGLHEHSSEAIAVLIHGVQMLFFITLGGISLVYLSVNQKNITTK